MSGNCNALKAAREAVQGGAPALLWAQVEKADSYPCPKPSPILRKD